MKRLNAAVAGAVACLGMCGAVSASHCTPVVDLILGTPGAADSLISEMWPTNLLDGGANRLIVTGGFSGIGGVAGTSGIAVWDGAVFKPLGAAGAGIDPGGSGLQVNTVIEFGGKIYIGGQFDGAFGGPVSRGVIRFNPATDSYEAVNTVAVGVGILNINAFAIYKGELHACGNITTIGGTTTNGIAKYDPVADTWSAVGGGTNSTTGVVMDMAVFNDGSGEKLYICGNYSTVGPALASITRWVACWDGTNWNGVGPNGLSSAATRFPRDLQVWDDGSGPALFCGGGLNSEIGDPTTSSILKWDGKTWTSIPGFQADPLVTAATVNAIGLYNDGTGTTMYAQVRFFGAALVPTARQVLVRYENGVFNELPMTDFGTSSVFEFQQYNDGSGSKLWMGGGFSTFNGAAASRLAQITGCTQVCPPDPCPADFNNDDDVQVNDIFSFLNAWFSAFGSGCP